MAYRELSAGVIRAWLDSGTLRNIRMGDVEILRQVYFTLRDENWKTVVPRIVSEQVIERPEGFEARLELHFADGEVDFLCQMLVRGMESGSIELAAGGTANRSFQKNRLGFCVLHPIDGCAGQPCRVEHSDGTWEAGVFPQSIAPHQPFFDIRSIAHSVAPGLEAVIIFEGEVFEMEDHRNWTDQSYKTYCTPLAEPRPVTIPQGTRVSQTVRLELRPAPPRPVEIVLVGMEFPTPRIGPIDHVRVEVHPGQPLSLPSQAVELAVFAARPEDVERLTTREEVTRVLTYSPDGYPATPAVIAALRERFSCPVGSGSNLHFAELNRNRPDMKNVDFLHWAITPTNHALDEITVFENLEGQFETAKACAAFAEGKPMVASPVWVPDVPNPAAWVAGSIAQLARGGVSSITFSRGDSFLEEFRAAQPLAIAGVRSTDPRRALALGIRTAGGIKVWVANLLGTNQQIVLGAFTHELSPYEMRAFPC